MANTTRTASLFGAARFYSPAESCPAAERIRNIAYVASKVAERVARALCRKRVEGGPGRFRFPLGGDALNEWTALSLFRGNIDQNKGKKERNVKRSFDLFISYEE